MVTLALPRRELLNPNVQETIPAIIQLCRRTAVCAAAAAYTSPLPVFQQMCETGASSLAHWLTLYCLSAMLTTKTPPLSVPTTSMSLKGLRALAATPLHAIL